jgi:hypothetical protein
VLDSEREEEQAAEEAAPTKEKEPEAAREAPPADGKEAKGSDSESPDDEDAALDALVEKYQGKPRSIAKALRGIRSLQTATAEEKKALEERFEAAAAIIDSDYDLVDGKYTLKPDVAGRTLRATRGEQPKILRVPSEAEIRAQVEGDFKTRGGELFDESQMPAYLQHMKPLIDQTVAERLNAAKATADANRTALQVACGDIVNRHIAAHPDDKELLPELDKLYSGIPEEARAIAFLEEWFPFGKMAELVRTQKALPKMLKEAYKLGREHRGQAATITEAGSPKGSGATAPRSGRGTRSDAERDFKDSVIRGSGLPSLDSLVSSR